MTDYIKYLYVKFFAKNKFEKFNKFLLRLSLGGLGVLNYKNNYESGEKSFLGKYIPKKGGLVIDVGANVGDYINEVFEYGEEVRVIAFEPHPITYQKLSERFINNPRVDLINSGLSSSEEFLEIFDNNINDGSSHASLYKEVITDVHKYDSLVSHKVSLLRLDDFVESHKIDKINILKIDAEGNEFEVLKGAQKTIAEKRIEIIHFEFNEMNIISRNYFRDFSKLLDGYIFYRMLPNELLRIEKYSPLYCEIFAYQNIVAIRNDV